MEVFLKSKVPLKFSQVNVDSVTHGNNFTNVIETESGYVQRDQAIWYQIGDLLQDSIPDQPLRVLDLSCQPSVSVDALNHFLPAGSTIFRTERSGPLTQFAPGSIDLVHTTQLIGHHFDLESLVNFSHHIQKILAPRGFAILDYGPEISDDDLQFIMEATGWRQIKRAQTVPCSDSGQILFEWNVH